MFDGNYDDTDGRYEISSLQAVQEAALIMYGRFLAHLYGREPTDELAKKSKRYLTLQETENIVREHSECVTEDGTYAVGGDTPEEAKSKVNELLAALMDRIMSNVLAAGVKEDLLDCTYDPKIDDFSFTVTDKGKQIVEDIRQERDAADRPDISGDQAV